MDFENCSPFSALAYVIEDPGGEEHDVVVVRGTFELRRVPEDSGAGGPTHTPIAADEQAPIVVSDETFGAMNKSSVRIESDLAQQKPKCDVIVIADATSPTGDPTPRFEIGIRIERTEPIEGIDETGLLMEVALTVCGPRAFRRDAAADTPPSPAVDRWRLSEPEPFVSMPLRYEEAFGGELRVPADHEAADRVPAGERLSEQARSAHPDGASAPIAHAISPRNPFGKGFLQRWYEEALSPEEWPAPRVEAPAHPLTVDAWRRFVRGESDADKHPALQVYGMGVIAKPWQPRLARAGTLDDKWLAERWPLMPLDFDMAYWNGAHPDLWSPYLFGAEVITLRNLAPPARCRAEDGASVIRFRVPRPGVALRLRNQIGNPGWAIPSIDTVIIDLDRMVVSFLWRLVAPKSLGIASATLVQARMKGADPPANP